MMIVTCEGEDFTQEAKTLITITDTQICVGISCNTVTSITKKAYHSIYNIDKPGVYYKVRDNEVVKYNDCEVTFYTNE